jgi:hypothetical protein
MELEIVMLSKTYQTEKDKYHMFFLICGIQTQTEIQEYKDQTVWGGEPVRRVRGKEEDDMCEHHPGTVYAWMK